jgi:23S rRNA pseudouridine2605 synthase
MQERLQKIMAASGIASRRKAEEIIAAGRVTLNGKVVTEPGTKADAEKDLICVDGVPLRKRERLLYFMLHKPKGYVTTVSDPDGRPTVMELMKDCPERVYPVGRLDYASEGLLLMTNDGALAAKLMKAGSHAPKTYLVKISGKPDERVIARLRAGVTIELEDGKRVKTSPAKIRLMEDGAKGSGPSASLGVNEWRVTSGERANPWYEVTLIEGRNRQIRRMFQSVGFLVEKIKRVQLGPLVLDVAPGKFRALTEREVAKLKSVVEGVSR